MAQRKGHLHAMKLGPAPATNLPNYENITFHIALGSRQQTQDPAEKVGVSKERPDTGIRLLLIAR